MDYHDDPLKDKDSLDRVGLLDDDIVVHTIPQSTCQAIRPAAVLIVLFFATNLATLFLTRQYFNTVGSASYRHILEGPLSNRLSLPVYDAQRDDTLLPDASVPRHIYRLPPSPEVDAAWDAITPNGLLAVSEEELRRAGKDPEYALRIPEEWGYGSNKFAAILDGVHQVHCLDLIRKNLLVNYEYYYGRRYNFTPPIFLEAHLNHCLDSLLQDLMCHADTHLTTFNWVHGQSGGQPDFAVNRQCRNYDVMLKWFRDNTIVDWEERVKRLQRQPDEKERPRFVGWAEYVKDNVVGYDGDRPLGRMKNLPPSCVAT